MTPAEEALSNTGWLDGTRFRNNPVADTYIAVPGDNPSRIAAKMYGDPNLWPLLGTDRVSVGQVFEPGIPTVLGRKQAIQIAGNYYQQQAERAAALARLQQDDENVYYGPLLRGYYGNLSFSGQPRSTPAGASAGGQDWASQWWQGTWGPNGTVAKSKYPGLTATFALLPSLLVAVARTEQALLPGSGAVDGVRDIRRGHYLMGTIAIASEIPVLKELKAVDLAADAARAAHVANSAEVDLALKYRPDWTEAQRAEAAAKVQILNDAPTVVTSSERTGTAAAMNRYRRAEQVPSGRDIDHMVDLQLGGGKTVDNLWSLDSSVNRSLGAQVQQQIKNLPPGTLINRVTIGD